MPCPFLPLKVGKSKMDEAAILKNPIKPEVVFLAAKRL